MSLFDRRSLIFLPLALAACGFSPVYEPGSAIYGQIQIDPPETRDAYLLVKALEARLGRSRTPLFTLTSALTISEQGSALNATGDIARVQLIGKVSFTLHDLSDGDVVLRGEAENFTGYSNTGSTVETLAAQSDARERLVTILAEQVTAQILAANLGGP